MADQYTPTTEEVREEFWAASGQPRRGGAAFAEFDRWLAAHDAQVLDAFFDEMEKRNWSTGVCDITTARNAALRRIAGGTSHE